MSSSWNRPNSRCMVVSLFPLNISRTVTICYYQDILAALDVIEGVNMRLLSKPEHRADILAQKAHLFAMLGRSEEAMKTFSQSIQICDNVPGAWALWAQYCDELFQVLVQGRLFENNPIRHCEELKNI